MGRVVHGQHSHTVSTIHRAPEGVSFRVTRSLLFVESELVEQKAASGLVPGSCDSLGWGLGVSVVTRRNNITAAHQAIDD